MKENVLLINYKDLTEEELIKLPVEELAHIAYEALQNWDKLNQNANQDSTNSHRAPSTDSPEAKAKRQAEQSKKADQKNSKRQQGAQPGHKAVIKPLLELREGDTIVACAPEVCKQCGNSLPKPSSPALSRHQKIDVEIHRRVTEYQVYRTTCSCCGHATAGNLPDGVKESCVSENVTALVGVLTGVCHLSRRMTRMLLDRLFDVPVSLGTVSQLEKELTEASAPVMEELEKAAHRAERGNADETGFGLKNGKTGWLWVLVTPMAILFRLFANRTQECAGRLLGKFSGILTTDRYSGYNQHPKDKRQLCWAHLKRDFKSMCGEGENGHRIGLGLLRETRLVFRCWHRFQHWRSHQANVSLTSLESQLKPYRRRMLALLEEGASLEVSKCATILKVESLLWTFAGVEGIEPTNNAAERAIRPSVLWKKRCFGVESERGARYVEAMLSITATCQCNGLNVVDYLKQLMTAHRSHSTIPNIFAPQQTL
jgi:transposase